MAVLLIAASLAGCAAAAPETVSLDRASHGRTATVRLGGLIRLALPSNATTGYQWELATSGGAVLENTLHRYVPPNTDRVGAGGVEQWEFRARQPGGATLRLEYRRPWESKSLDPAETFEVAVTVPAP